MSNVKSIFGKIDPKVYIALLIGFVVILGIGLVAGFEIGVANQPKTTEPFHLDLIETMANNEPGVQGAQASYFQVTTNGQLIHPATITVPANRIIELTITAYDMGNLTVAPQYLQVSGTQNNQMTLVNGSMAAMGNAMHYATNVSSVPAGAVLHTFTVAKLNINIPVIAGYTEIAFINPITQTGTFHWQCMAPCGTGSSGWGATMSDNGWMSGSLVVS